MIRQAQNSDALSLALIHLETLKESFLSKLGLVFLTKMYSFLIQNEHVILFSNESLITGFISFSKNSTGMMKRFLISKPDCIFLLAYQIIIHPTIVFKIWETFRAPFKSKSVNKASKKSSFPSGELLSIAVSSNQQISGIGSNLVYALEEYLNLNQISQYKVVVGDELIGANKFYLKHGFVLASQIMIHGDNLSNVYIKEI